MRNEVALTIGAGVVGFALCVYILTYMATRHEPVEWQSFLESLHETVSFARIGPLPTQSGYFDPGQLEQVLINLLKNAHESGSAVTYPTGISGDIEQQLKYDARVEGFDPGDADLTVNVNDSWLSSPPGMQERSVGQWYSLWHANHSGGVIIKHGDNKIASWTSAGFKPEPKSAGGESHSE